MLFLLNVFFYKSSFLNGNFPTKTDFKEKVLLNLPRFDI